MSQEQPTKPQPSCGRQQELKYGDVFKVSGELADKPIAPEDAAMMQAAETTVYAPEVVGQYVQATPVVQSTAETGQEVRQSAITIGEALEASALSAGNKPVDHSDAAAIQAAECRATGSSLIIPGGIAVTAQSAAAYNEGLIGDEAKIKLADVLTGATAKLPADKAVTREDAEGIISAEVRDEPNLQTHPGGVAASVVAAARINERDTSS